MHLMSTRNKDIGSDCYSPLSSNADTPRSKFLTKFDMKINQKINQQSRNKIKFMLKSKSMRRKRKDFNLSSFRNSPEVCSQCHEFLSVQSTFSVDEFLGKRRESKIHKLEPYKMQVAPNFEIDLPSPTSLSRNIYSGESSQSRKAEYISKR